METLTVLKQQPLIDLVVSTPARYVAFGVPLCTFKGADLHQRSPVHDARHPCLTPHRSKY
jgi:hypothetical protein